MVPNEDFKKHKIGTMSLDNFTDIIERNKDYLVLNNIGVESYFRGEPLLHPQFWEICEVLRNNSVSNA